MAELRVWCVVLVSLAVAAPAAAVVGGEPAAPPEPDAAVVFVQRHGRSARLEGLKDDKLGYYSFYGIRLVFTFSECERPMTSTDYTTFCK